MCRVIGTRRSLNNSRRSPFFPFGLVANHHLSRGLAGKLSPTQPTLAFLRMASLRPAPYRLPNLIVHCSKDLPCDRVPVKVRPAAQQRIKGCNQVRLGRRTVSLYEFSDSAEQADDRLS